jgi:hypothetical protein
LWTHQKGSICTFDWGIEYRIDVDTSLLDSCSVDISRVIDTMEHIGYKVVDDDMVHSGMQQYTMVYDSVKWFLGYFRLGDLQTGTSDISLSLVHPRSMSGWTSFMKRNIPWSLIFEWDITRAGTKSRILDGFVDTERGVNQYQVQFKNLFQLILKPFNYIQ